MSADVTRTLARFVRDGSYATAAPGAQRATDRTILNAGALAIGAADHPSVTLLRRVHEGLGATPAVSLLGRGQQLGVFAGPLVNAMAVHVEDYDDTHLRTVVHPGAPIMPAAVAAAELRGASGHDVVSGVLVGTEVALRVANSICPEHFDRGWHLTGTAGHLGAAAAASRVAGLDVDRTVAALGLAATQAAGLTAANGSMTKALHPAKAAADGLEAVLLAERGLTGPPEPIVGRHGFARVASPRIDVSEILDDLGTRWEIEQNAIKPYACGIVSHAVIDASRALRSRVDVAQISEVDVRIPQVVLDVMGIEDPRDGLQSKFSVRHCAAVGLLDGDGSPREFSDERAVADDVRALRARIATVVDPAVPKGAALVTVRTTSGEELTEEVRDATASAARPMTDAQLDRKVRNLIREHLGDAGVVRFLAACDALAAAPDVHELIGSSRHPVR